jgi:glycerol-3-phosphate dehydrogenase
VSRSHALLDHATRDGVENLVTITGGKWTTYRLMAEEAADLVCRKLGTDRPGRTATTPLLPHQARKFFTVGRRLTHLEANEQLICECELVTRPPIEARLAQGDTTLDDLRRDLRLGMGPCQGTFCAYRATGMMMEEAGQLPAGAVNRALADFLEERWKGLKPVLWGAQLRQVGLEQGIYLGLLGLDKLRGGGEQKP